MVIRTNNVIRQAWSPLFFPLIVYIYLKSCDFFVLLNECSMAIQTYDFQMRTPFFTLNY